MVSYSILFPRMIAVAGLAELWLVRWISRRLRLPDAAPAHAAVSRQPARGKTNRAASGVCLGSAALILILQFLGLCDLYETMFWHGLLCVVLLLVCVFAARPRGREILWLLPFPLALGADLILIRATGTARFAALSLLWVALNLCIRGAGFVSEASSPSWKTPSSMA